MNSIAVHTLRVNEAYKQRLIRQWRTAGENKFYAQQSRESCGNQYERAGYDNARRNWLWRQEWESWSA